MKRRDVMVVGGGHNGLVCATLLARKGLAVTLLERSSVVGGAARTETPFRRAPTLRQSTGAYLLGLVPPELLARLELELPLLRRDPHYFLPTLGSESLLLGSDRLRTREQLLRFFSAEDADAVDLLDRELSLLREDLGPAWLEPPRSLRETAERYVRPALRGRFVELCERPIAEYLPRFGFESELLMAMFATTDAFSGLDGTWDTPGTGMNFLVHNLCRLPGSEGTWMILQGGMGTFTQKLRERFVEAGGEIVTDAKVSRIVTSGGSVTGVEWQAGALAADSRRGDALEEHGLETRTVVCATDPFTLLDLVGEAVDAVDPAYRALVESKRRPGTTLKLNLALSGLPRFRCLPEDHGQHRGTMHLLPQGALLPPGKTVLDHLGDAYRTAKSGEMPTMPTIEWYVHTTVDPSLAGGSGLHSAALFVQWAPNRFRSGTWAEHEPEVIEGLLRFCDEFAPGTSGLVVDHFLLHPERIESYFGMANGHIHHVDNGFGWDQRVPYRTPIAGLYSGGAGGHPAGSVIGAAGHNTAETVLEDLGLR